MKLFIGFVFGVLFTIDLSAQDTLHFPGGWHVKGMYKPGGQYLWVHYGDRFNKDVGRVEMQDGWWCFASRNFDLVRVGHNKDSVLLMLVAPQKPDGIDYWKRAIDKYGHPTSNMPECSCGIRFWWSWEVYQWNLISRKQLRYLMGDVWSSWRKDGILARW